ncbi:MAG: gliding motility protein GldC [Flavobacteriales bacterium]
MKKEEIKFNISLDENNIPEKLSWMASDGASQPTPAEACIISIWDPKEENALRIDLWTKEMKMDAMKHLIHQTMATLGDTYLRATNDEKLAGEIKQFSEYFAKEAKLYEKKK